MQLSAHIGEGTAKSFIANIRSSSFLGDHYVFELDAGGLSLSARDTKLFSGPTLLVRIPPGACRVLVDEDPNNVVVAPTGEANELATGRSR
jgi:hypothetical protein